MPRHKPRPLAHDVDAATRTKVAMAWSKKRFSPLPRHDEVSTWAWLWVDRTRAARLRLAAEALRLEVVSEADVDAVLFQILLVVDVLT